MMKVVCSLLFIGILYYLKGCFITFRVFLSLLLPSIFGNGHNDDEFSNFIVIMVIKSSL